MATRTRLKPQPHEPALDCAMFEVHCYGCHLDHDPDMPAWLWCLECGHAYRRPRDLRKAYRREMWQLLREHSSDAPWLVSNDWYPSMAWHVWRIVTARASKIYFCQECLHDF